MSNPKQNRTSAQERISMNDKSTSTASQKSGRPSPSTNSINPNRGLNEDEQKKRVNSTEDDKTVNIDKESTADEGNSLPSKDAPKSNKDQKK